jgi:hypothetical protein
MSMKKIQWIIVLVAILIIVLFSGRSLTTTLFGESAPKFVRLEPGNIGVPYERKMVWKTQSAFADSIIKNWSERPIADNMLSGKGTAPRILLAMFFAKHHLDEANKILMKNTVWGVSGSSWILNKKGDYDFTATIYTTILYLFGDQPDVLYPETKKYLLDVLLYEDGNKFRYTAPRTLGLVNETENHLLMTEGSRYLKNRWIQLHGNNEDYFNNEKNGMESKLLVLLDEMKTAGLYEFNSNPYVGYTITALLNLEAFASEKIREEARNVLDYMNFCYALGSYQLKHYPPMRRRYEKASFTSLVTDYHSIFFKSWLSYSEIDNYNKDVKNGDVHALMGSIMPYRPADKAVELLFNKGDGYFVKLGHGSEASPEIYSAGKNFLISPGGVNRGKRSLIVAKPITLFLNDQATELLETFHLAGPGTDFMKWNNTGVCQNFAVAAGPVNVPSGYIPVAQKENWNIYQSRDSLLIAVYSSPHLGILSVHEKQNPQELADRLFTSNSDAEKLKTQFLFPGGLKIIFDVYAPKEKWVIKSIDGNPVNRNYDQWPLIEGDMK